MVDLDSTQIINADESLIQNASTFETEASLKIVSGAESNIYSITKETIIGRGNPSDLVIAAPSLSKQHAKISYNNGQYFITDLGSSNKTSHNKIQLQPNVCYALHDGDEIKLGDLVCSFHEHKSTKTDENTGEKDNVDIIPSTQAITDSYDNEEPTQPIKIWNGNSNNAGRLSRTSLKDSDENLAKQQNGAEQPTSNGSSAFVSTSMVPTVPVDDQDDGSLVIGAATLPATVPLDIESTQINEDQSEVVTTTETQQIIEERASNGTVSIETKTTTTTVITTDVEVENTQAYTLEPIIQSNGNKPDELEETQAYDMQIEPPIVVTDVIETKKEEIHKVTVTGDQLTEEITTITTTSATTTAIVENTSEPIETLAYDLQPNVELTQTETKTTAISMDTQAYDLEEQIKTVDSSLPSTSENDVSIDLTDNTKKLEDVCTSEKSSNQPVQIEIQKEIVTDTLVNDQMEVEQNETPKQDAAIEENQSKSVEKSQVSPVPEEPHSLTSTQDATVSSSNKEEMMIDESEKPATEENITPTAEPLAASEKNAVVTNEDSTKNLTIPLDTIPSATESEQQEQTENADDEPVEDGEAEGEGQVIGRTGRGVPRRNARRARGRRAAASGRARVVSTRIYGGRRNVVLPESTAQENNNTTLEETIQSETEESPKKSADVMPDTQPIAEATQPIVQAPETPSKDNETTNQTSSSSNIRVSARIKARASSGRNRQFPYTDDYIDLDDLEKQSKTVNAAASVTNRKSTRSGRGSTTPQKRISLRQTPAETSESPDTKSGKHKGQTDPYEDMDTGGENEEPMIGLREASIGRKRKSMTPVSSVTSKRTRSTTPQTAPPSGSRRKPTAEVDHSATTVVTTPKRLRRSAKSDTAATSETVDQDRPVRIALSSHLNFDQTHLDALRKMGFEIMDESCQVDALVVDRIRRTKKFFMCLARGAHILSPSWIETMIKENVYVPYDKFYLEDTAAETRYGFQLRESVQRARKQPIFQNYRVFCTKDTSPPYDDLKDIIEAAGGKFIDKINMSRPGKDLICIVAQAHKSEYEDLSKKGVPIVSEEFALSGVSKQKLDVASFSLFANTAAAAASTGKSASTK